MKCPYCNKEIYGLTGLQELQKFQKHSGKCKRNLRRQVFVDKDGKLRLESGKLTMKEALEERAKSGQ